MDSMFYFVSLTNFAMFTEVRGRQLLLKTKKKFIKNLTQDNF